MATFDEIEDYITDTQAHIYALSTYGEYGKATAEILQLAHNNYKSLWKAYQKLGDEYRGLVDELRYLRDKLERGEPIE